MLRRLRACDPRRDGPWGAATLAGLWGSAMRKQARKLRVISRDGTPAHPRRSRIILALCLLAMLLMLVWPFLR